MDWFQVGKGVRQGCILSPCLFNFYAVYNVQNARLDESQTGIKIARKNSNNLRYEGDTTLKAKNEEELKLFLELFLDKCGKGEWKSCLEAQHPKKEDRGIWSHHFMGNRWGNNRNSDRLYFLGSKITVDSDCGHGIKRHLLLGRKVMTNLDSILKSRDITLLTKVCMVEAIVFQVVI